MSPEARRRAFTAAWSVLLVACLAAVVVLNRAAAGADRPASSGPVAGPPRHGFRFTESSKALGIDFAHEAPTFDARLEHIMPQVAAMGASVAVSDVDRDGRLDFYVTNSREGSLNRLYRQRADGTFEDVAGAMGVADVNRAGTGVSMGAIWGDYDGDGDEDLFVYKYGQAELFRNEGGSGFVAVTAAAGLTGWVNANTAVWFDYDRDGRLDLFLPGYWPESVDLWSLQTTRIMPESFEYAENGGRNWLFHNRGDGTFEEVAEAMGVSSRRWTLAAAASDIFGTGWPDLFLANDYGVSEIFANQEGKRFVEAGKDTGVGKSPKSGMNAAFGDVFNDGRLAIYKTNISEPGVLVQANDLWVPERSDDGLRFTNLATTLGIDLGGWSWGAQFGDLNNDGTLDLFLVNGYVSAGERTSYWYDFSQIAVGHSTIIGDAANWPAMRGRSLSGYQPSRVWINDGAGSFTDVAQEIGVTDVLDGRAVALADLNADGGLDAIVANQRGPLLVYVNEVDPSRRWIVFDLEGAGGNSSAIGARVEIEWGGRRQVQEVGGGSGFASQGQRRLHFGLGSAETVDRARIRWPSGRTAVLEGPATNVAHRVKESP